MCPPTTALHIGSPAKHRLMQVCVRQQRKGEGGKENLPVTRKSNKGKKSSISLAKCTHGRNKAERERARKRERLCTPARLQIYSYQALRALPCLFLQPVKTNCSHVSINHILFSLIHYGRAFGLLCYFSLNYCKIKTFLQ